MTAPNDDAIEMLRRMGRRVVECHHCHALMDEPPDPFEGPHVLWAEVKSRRLPPEVFYVCSTGCRVSLRAGLKGGQVRLKRTTSAYPMRNERARKRR